MQFNLIQILVSLIAFLFAIGILVVFHEFGHFWVAKKLGIKVLRFSVGFGKPLWRFTDKEQTEYVIAALPFGGYVKMLDEREEEVLPHQLHQAFNRQKLWKRFLVVFAGPLFNFIFAILVYWLIYTIGIEGRIPTIGKITPNSIAAMAGMQSGEEIIEVENKLTPTWQLVVKQLMTRIGDKDSLSISTQHQDQIKNYQLDIATWELKGKRPDLLHSLGIKPQPAPLKPIIDKVVFGEPAYAAGIQKGDLIVAVNGKPISNWYEFTDVSEVSIGKTITLTLDRNGEKVDVSYSPRAKENNFGEIAGFSGLVVKITETPKSMLRTERLNPFRALIVAFEKTYEFTLITFRTIWKMLMGDIGLKALSGPLSIAEGAGNTASLGFQHYLSFLALISISLAVINLLPIPILDGGHLLYYFIEMITGKEVSVKFQMYGYKLGILMIIMLMTVAFYNDIVRLF